MKKMVLLILTSLSISCLGVPIRINLVARGGVIVPLIGDYYDEQTNTITTPFNFINHAIVVINFNHKEALARETDQPGLFEYCGEPIYLFGATATDTDSFLLEDIDSQILDRAIALITDHGYNINQLDLPTITQLINVYDVLGAPQAIIDVLLERCVELSIKNPEQTPFAAELRVASEIPKSPWSDCTVLRSGSLICAARNLVTQRFKRKTDQFQPWISINLDRGGVSVAAVSPKEPHVVIAQNGDVGIWNINGNRERRFEHDFHGVSSVAFSPDGQHIGVGENPWWDFGLARVGVWKINGELNCMLIGHQDMVTSVAFSPDGQRVITTSRDQTARIWKMNGECEKVLYGQFTTAAFLPDGQRIIAGLHDATIRIMNVSGELTGNLEGHRDSITSVVVSSDGQHIATGSEDCTVRIWTIGGEFEGELKGHQGKVTSVAFSQDCKHIITKSEDYSVRIWNLHGKCERLFEHEYPNAVSVAFLPDGRHVIITSTQILYQEQAWNWCNWPVDNEISRELINYEANVLKQLFTLKNFSHPPVTREEILASLGPEDAREFFESYKYWI